MTAYAAVRAGCSIIPAKGETAKACGWDDSPAYATLTKEVKY